MKKIIKRSSILFTALLSLSVGTSYVTNEPTEVRAAATTVTMTTFTATEDSLVDDTTGETSLVSYTTAKGGGTSNPAINSGVIRLYQNSAGTGGGTITLTVPEGYEFSNVTIGSSMETSIAYTLGESTTKSSTSSMTANSTYSVDFTDFEEKNSITFYCMGTTSKTRLYVNHLSATYDVANTDDSGDTTVNPISEYATDASLAFDYYLEYNEKAVYTLVQDTSELVAGDQVIIVSDEYDYAMSTTQNSNNRGQASIVKATKEVEGTTYNYIANIGNDVQVLTLGINATNSYYTFYTGEAGYLYAAGSASSGNYLKTKTIDFETEEEPDLDAQWTITIADGVTTIDAQGDAQRSIIKYNATNSSGAIFSCYSSGQTEVSLYKLNENVTEEGIVNQAYRNVKIGFGAQVDETLFTEAPTEAGIIFTSADLTNTSISKKVGTDLSTFLNENTDYKSLSKANPVSKDGYYTVGGAIQVIGENEFVNSTNIDRLDKVVTAAVYFVIANELVVLEDKSYSVSEMLEEYSSRTDLTADQLTAVNSFRAYIL